MPSEASRGPLTIRGRKTNNEADPLREHRPTGASLAAILLVLLSFGAVMLLHVLHGGIDPMRQVMSEYANGSHGPVMTAVFYAFGLSSIALAIRFRGAFRDRWARRAIPLLLALAGISLIASGIFEVERPLIPDTLEEGIHSNATVGAFVFLITSMVLVSLACRSDARWWRFRWTSMALSLGAAFAAMATPLSAQSNWSGAVQRLLGLTVLLWLVLSALHVRGRAFRTKW